MSFFHNINQSLVSKAMTVMESEHVQKLMESPQAQKLLELCLKCLNVAQQTSQIVKSQIVNSLDVVSREELEQKLVTLRKEIEERKL